MENYASSNVKVCFLCYRAYPEILGSILCQCEDMNDEEKDKRVKMTLTGKCATILAIIGSKKQLSLFPETLDAGRHRNGAVVGGRSVGQVLGNSLGFDDDNEEDEEEQSHDQNQAQQQSQTSKHTDQIESAPANHKNTAAAAASSSNSRAESTDPRLEQIKQLGMWVERFFDGSLKRYRVKDWPDWHTVSQ